jgi:hypothetical protein
MGLNLLEVGVMPKENIDCIAMTGLRVEVSWSHAPTGHVQVATVHTDSPINWSDGDSPNGKFNGWHATLDREGVNRLIRQLRKARDTAYGADA